MAFRFQRRIKIAPGLRLNISKTGISTSIGRNGATLNLGKDGVTRTVGLPGTGLSHRQRINTQGDDPAAAAPGGTSRVLRILGALALGGIIYAVVTLIL